MISSYWVVAFYQFTALQNVPLLQEKLKTFCDEQAILGTILLAEEGINGTVASTEAGIKALVAFLSEMSCFKNMEFKYSVAPSIPFKKMKILSKKEIVTLGIPHINPSEKTGQYVSAEAWNDFISQEDVLLIDTRNDFEVEIGSFKGAIDPATKKFSDFPEFVKNMDEADKNKKIAMYCTGGIRCEKASAYLLEQGFSEVYQLEGGILKYLERIPTEQSLWQGDCFIFDERVVLKKETIKTLAT